MASRVNLKFVFILGGVMVLIAAGVVWFGLKNYSSSGEQNIARGQEAEKKGDLKQAIMYYGRAVNKDRGNVEWVQTWLSAIEKYTPQNAKAYSDMYGGEYLPAIRALADADRRNALFFKRYLEERFKYLQYQPSSLRTWEGFERETKDIINLYQGDDAGKRLLKRYHGVAVAGQFVNNPDLDAEVVKAADKELKEALDADPKDQEAALARNNIARVQAEKAIRTNHQPEAEKLLADAHNRLEEFLKTDKDNLRVRLALLEADIAASARTDGKETMLELLKRNNASIGALADIIMATPPEKTDDQAALALAHWVPVVFDDGPKRASDLLEHVAKGHGTEAMFLLNWARLDMARNQIDHAIELEQKVVALPDKPMSLEGLLLHDFRRAAVQMQADAWFVRTQIETDPEKRAAAVQKLKDVRKELAERVGESHNAVLAIDGRLDYLAGDFAGARTRVSRYNDQTQQTDGDMVMLEAQLLSQLGQKGAAKTKYERVLTLQKNQNVRALYYLGLIELNDRDYRAAANHLGLASAMYPPDTRLRDLAKDADDLAKGTKTDEVLNCLTSAQDIGMGITGDIQKSMAILRECLAKHPDDLRLVIAMTQYLVASKDIDGAKALLQDAIRNHPENKNLPFALAQIEKDPLSLVLDRINDSKATDLQKHLGRFQAYTQGGKNEEARAELAAAVKTDPNDIGVINAQFDDALIRKDFTEQDRIVTKARAMNLDKVGGDLFFARSLMNRQKIQEAVGTLRDITGKDKLNLMAWRLLGLALFDQGQYVAAADALKTAVSIKPDDVLSINACLHALIAAGQGGEALNMARKSEYVAVADTDFFETLLALEAGAPGGDKNKAIEARRKYAERRPANRANKTRLGSLLINAGKTDEAEKLIADLLKEDPNDPVAVQLKAACLGRQNKVADSVQVLLQFIASRKPEDRTVELYINTARLMLELGQPDEAVKLLTDNRSAQDPKDAKEKKTALIDRELGDIKYNLAANALDEKKYKEMMESALASYQTVLDSGSEDSQNIVRMRMIEVCMKSKDYTRMDKIIAQLPQAVQNDPTILLLEAEAAMNQWQSGKDPAQALKDKDKAGRLYDQAVAANNKNATAYLKRGDFKSLDPNTLKDALADYEQMKRVEPGSVIARVRMARVFRMLGRDDDAVRAIKDAVTIDPYNEQLRLAVALMLREIGKNAEAAQAMEDAVTQFNGAKQWRMGAADYWARVGKWDKAVEHMREVWKEDKSVGVAIAFAEYLLNSGDTANAWNVLQTKEVAPLVSDSLPMRMLRARIYAKGGRTADAAQEISESLGKVKPESLEDAALFMSGVAGMYPKLETQISTLDRLEQAKPFAGYLALRANEVRLRDPNTRAAALVALQSLAEDPRLDPKVDAKVGDRIKARAWSLLGTQSYGEKKWEEAYARFEKGQKLDPENAELNNNLAYILATKLNKCKEALPFAVKACSVVSNKSDFLDTLGAAQLCAQKCDDAAKTLSIGLQAALNDSDRVPIYIHMGKARICQGDKIEARRVANVARDLMANLPDIRKQYQADWDELDRSIHAN